MSASIPVLRAIWHGVCSVFRVSRKIPAIDAAVYFIERRLFNPVVIKLVRDPADPDLESALDLYKKKIPDDQRFEVADIINWIREDQISRRRTDNSTLPTDWFIVALHKHRVSGFVLFHYYPIAQLAMFAYMVVAATPGVAGNLISNSLSGFISRLLSTRKELHGCTRIVLEVEDPRKEKSKPDQDECLARIRRFCTLAEMRGLSLRAFDFEYRQPKLATEDADNTERPLLLLYARTHPESAANNSMSARAEVAEILTFIYTRVYPEGYSSDRKEDRLYREYCSQFKDRQIASLPTEIRSLSLKQLVAQVRLKAGASAHPSH
jgi:hypothetical protein